MHVSFSEIANPFQMTRGLNSIRRTERQLLTQAVLLFIVLTTLITCWHYYQLFLPDTIWTLFSINIYWILYCGLNPLLHITFSKYVEMELLKFPSYCTVYEKTVIA